MRWLRRFFYSDDPDVKFVDGLTELEAASFEELLANNGVVAMRKNMEALYDRLWRPVLPLGNHFALFLKRSDVERARDILGPMLQSQQPARDRRRWGRKQRS